MARATSTDLATDREAPGEAARKRAALELIKRHERVLGRTARRYSLCADDAEDAYQRALVILLTKAPTEDPLQLIRWMQTVTKHEALAVRRNRERLLGSPGPANRDEEGADWVQLIPSEQAGPADLTERRERAARSREALQTLKPQELRALTLLAEGYSYREISRITGWTRTKVNRCLAEGRARFRAVISSSESGGRCDDLSAALSAFSDGEASAAEATVLREHLRACAGCRATLRAFRAAPPAAAALAPGAAAFTVLDRVQAAFAGLGSRLPGRSGPAEVAISQVTAGGGTRGAGLAIGLKLLAACLGTAGGAAVGLATGVIPAPTEDAGDQAKPPRLERIATGAAPGLGEVRVRARGSAEPMSSGALPRTSGRGEAHSAASDRYSPASRGPSPEAPPPPAAPSSLDLRADRPLGASYVHGVSSFGPRSASIADASLRGASAESATTDSSPPSGVIDQAAAARASVTDLPPPRGLANGDPGSDVRSEEG